MIRIESITIKEFRGIRDLTLDFKGKSFAICGPNGTGKSGVVDALEFALTGSVSRLSGEGRGDISLKTHGPHVDSRNAPEKARVIVKVTIPSLSKTVTIERTVKAPAAPKVTPADADVLAILKQVQTHPEIVLSRRELIRYVLSTPGKRAEEVQALLHLDQVESVRAGLQKLANACKKDVDTLTGTATSASDNLLRALGIPTLLKDKVLAAANAQRALLGLAAITELTDSNSLKDGMATTGSAPASRIPRAQALQDLKTVREALAALVGPATTTLIIDAQGDLNVLATDPTLASGVTVENFFSVGLRLVVTEACPFCDSAWDVAALKAHVQGKIDRLKQVARKRKVAEGKLVPLIATLRNAQASLDAIVGHAAKATPPVNVQAVHDRSAACIRAASAMSAFLPIGETIAAVAGMQTLPKAVHDALADFERIVTALPEPSRQDAAREWLTLAQERLDQFRLAKRNLKSATERAATARKVSDTYIAASDRVLTGIYAKVQDGFAALYRFVNREDEDKFAAQLVPSMGKLGFDVDFYGRGFFPPGAYHSEGHQDGMGLCLYLALMRHLQGPAFTFAILDDVLMSVDAGHRREVCALLKQEFPNTQFVMTTHDPIWLRHMKTESLISGRAFAQFRRWDVDRGPAEWDDRDVWTEINDHLERNDVRAAASLLRHYLEYTSAELCHRLRVPVEYRGDAQYQLGELLPAAIRHMRETYADGKKAANSWGQKDRITEIAALETAFGMLATTSQAEQWQVNAAVHFNAWDNLGPKDFAPVARAYRDLLGGFACGSCAELLRVSPDRETRESLRCDCGKTAINLKVKPKGS